MTAPTHSRRTVLRRMASAVGAVSITSVTVCLGMFTSDRARYISVSEISIEGSDYEETKAAGEAAGYTVDGPYHGTLKEPSGIYFLSDFRFKFIYGQPSFLLQCYKRASTHGSIHQLECRAEETSLAFSETPCRPNGPRRFSSPWFQSGG